MCLRGTAGSKLPPSPRAFAAIIMMAQHTFLRAHHRI